MIVIDALLKDARSSTLTRFTNWVINPVIEREYWRLNPVRNARNFANAALRRRLGPIIERGTP